VALYEKYLAEALGITEDELNMAMREAGRAAVNQRMAEGKMDQQIADMLTSDEALHNYVALGLLTDQPF